MSEGINREMVPAQISPVWIFWTALIFGIGAPVLGTFLIQSVLPARSWLSLPFHSTLEVAGAAVGLVLGFLILFSQQRAQTSRRMWIALALISMATLDIIHSCVPVGVSFVWLHSLAVLAGGLFFALVWFPEREIHPGTALAAAGAALLVAVSVGVFSTLYPESLPAMVVEGGFTPAAKGINFLGGGLTLLAAVNFAIRCRKSGNPEDLLFLLLCLLFGGAGVLFQMSAIWETGWWFWHVLRLGGYILAFWLAMLSYRNSEEETVRTHGELDSMFHVAVDAKRLIDRDFNQLRTNDQFVALSGIKKEAGEKIKCHEAFSGPLCHTNQCPVRQFETGVTDIFEREVTKTRRDGKEAVCIMKAARLNAPDGSYRGVIESFFDITDRKLAENKLTRQAAQKAAQAELSGLLGGNLETGAMCRNIITFLCKYLEARTGVIYLANGNGTLNLTASYAHKRRKHLADRYKPGEGLVGQAALEKEDIILTNVPEDYIIIESGLGEIAPRNIYVKPIIHNNEVVGVMELGTLAGFTDSHSEFLDMVMKNIAVAIDSAKSRTQLAVSLEESRRLSEELQTQQEELKAANEELQTSEEELKFANEELQAHTERLQTSEERLKTQQEELQTTNEELEEKNELLEHQKREVERARKGIEEKAAEVALASKYKSQFLANMSHELRTPLNSLLILAQGLAENRDGNLTADQVESAKIVYGSGSDLLNLINEILDLSKIEAGRMDLHLNQVRVRDLADSVRASFRHMAEEKGIGLEVTVSGNAPTGITCDRGRVEQVIRNLTSNAIKFTETGSVRIAFGRPAPGKDLSKSGLSQAGSLAVAVKDTGMGIAREHQKTIFEAFQQVDGGTARKHGGTGLGLSISRELANLLGGEIQLESEPGKGAVFTLYLPIKGQETRESKFETGKEASLPGSEPASIPDDRESLGESDRVMLVIEDDLKFAKVLYDKCCSRGFKCLAASSGEAGLELAGKHLPDGVILDIRLPGMDGWAVLSALKDDIRTRHIPVHVVSVEKMKTESLRKGAIAHATKPINQEELEEAFKKIEETAAEKTKRVLLVEDDEEMRHNMKQLIGNGDVKVDEAATGEQGLEALRATRYGCLILDLRLPDMDGGEMLKRMEAEGMDTPPVIVHTARDLTEQEEMELRERAESIVIKDVHSRERLLDEVSLFLHRTVSGMPERKKQMIRNLHETDVLLKDKTVLVVDDDMRTTFALSRLLTEHGIQALKAGNGEQALQVLEQVPDVDLVLMDIMMPVVDGYETMKRIRARDRFRKLPIIALTAKAMPEDRKKCMDAGANDYLPKPVDQDRLISMMRVWLYR